MSTLALYWLTHLEQTHAHLVLEIFPDFLFPSQVKVLFCWWFVDLRIAIQFSDEQADSRLKWSRVENVLTIKPPRLTSIVATKPFPISATILGTSQAHTCSTPSPTDASSEIGPKRRITACTSSALCSCSSRSSWMIGFALA